MNAPIKKSAVLPPRAAQVRRAHRRLRARRHAGPAHGRRPRAPRTRMLDPKQVDAFIAVNADGTVTLYCGKVDLGTGLRIAIPQMVAEELGVPVERIKLIEGDTALTPDQGRTAGSNGIQRGGVQIRQAAATARKALIDLAREAAATCRPPISTTADGEVRPKAGGAGVKFADLLAGNRFDLKLDPKAPLKDPRTYTIVGKPLPRPDVPAKVTGTPRLHARLHACPTCCTAASSGRRRSAPKLVSVDEVVDREPAGRAGRADQEFPRRGRRGRVDLRARHARAEGAVERAAGTARRRPACSRRCAPARSWRDETLVKKGDAGRAGAPRMRSSSRPATTGRCRPTARSDRRARSPT